MTDDPLIGRELDGRYRLMRQLGKGGMGTVYVAWHEQLQRDVVVKVISRDRLENEVVARFKREALAVGQLAHPNIVSVYDFGDDGLLYLVMELLVGRSLRMMLDRRAMHVRESVDIIADVARGLAHAHSRGIVHRDLKPGNIMVVDAGGGRDFAKILDFGVASITASAVREVTATETGSGMMLGTPGYIAPEHVNGIHDDPRSDLYSLGCIWFEMLTGTEVFSGETPMKVVLRHVAEDPPRVLDRITGVPDCIDVLANRLLSKDPDDRPASAEAFLAELAAARAELANTATDELDLTPPPNALPPTTLFPSRPPDAKTLVPIVVEPSTMAPTKPPSKAPRPEPTTKVTPFDTNFAAAAPKSATDELATAELASAGLKRRSSTAIAAAVTVAVLIAIVVAWQAGRRTAAREEPAVDAGLIASPVVVDAGAVVVVDAVVDAGAAAVVVDAGTAAVTVDAGTKPVAKPPKPPKPPPTPPTPPPQTPPPPPPEKKPDDGFDHVHTNKGSP